MLLNKLTSPDVETLKQIACKQLEVEHDLHRAGLCLHGWLMLQEGIGSHQASALTRNLGEHMRAAEPAIPVRLVLIKGRLGHGGIYATHTQVPLHHKVIIWEGLMDREGRGVTPSEVIDESKFLRFIEDNPAPRKPILTPEEAQAIERACREIQGVLHALAIVEDRLYRMSGELNTLSQDKGSNYAAWMNALVFRTLSEFSHLHKNLVNKYNL